MPKVTNPLFSGDVRGQFGKRLIYTRGGVVRIYFKPRNPNTEAQQAQREAFKEFSMPGLTQEQADLLYAAIAHLHDDRYSLLGHDHDADYSSISHHHDGLYSQLGHTHPSSQLLFTNAGNVAVPAGATRYINPVSFGISTSATNIVVPAYGSCIDGMFTVAGSQPGSGSLVFTLMVNNSATDLVMTVSAGSGAVTVTNNADTAIVEAGDFVGWRVVNNASSDSALIRTGAVKLVFS